MNHVNFKLQPISLFGGLVFMSDNNKNLNIEAKNQTRLTSWVEKIGAYDLNNQGVFFEKMKKNTNFKEKLYESTDASNPKEARLKFYNFMINNFPHTHEQQAFKNEAVTMEAFLGKEGVELYKAACAEENRSTAFRDAVFLNSTKAYDGPKWTKKLRMWVGGPSASGKSFGTDNLIKSISKKFAKDESNLEKNYVTTIDGGVERQMSQVRQMVLQMALAEGYSDITDLEEKSKNLKTKKYVLNAALEDPTSNIVIPSTFTQGLKKQEKLMRDSAANKEDTVVVFTQVRGLPDEKEGFEQFKRSVKIMGVSRAARLALPKDKKEGEDPLIEPNNRDIGIESKAYNEHVFNFGVKKSNEARETFRDVCEGNGLDFGQCYYEITNDLVFIKKDKSNKWVEVTENDSLNDPSIVRTNRRMLTLMEQNHDLNLEPSDFTKEVILIKGKENQEWKKGKNQNIKAPTPPNCIRVSLAAFKVLGPKAIGNEKLLSLFNEYKKSIIHQGGDPNRPSNQQDKNEEKINVLIAGMEGMKKIDSTNNTAATPQSPQEGTINKESILRRMSSGRKNTKVMNNSINVENNSNNNKEKENTPITRKSSMKKISSLLFNKKNKNNADTDAAEPKNEVNQTEQAKIAILSGMINAPQAQLPELPELPKIPKSSKLTEFPELPALPEPPKVFRPSQLSNSSKSGLKNVNNTQNDSDYRSKNTPKSN